MRISDWSSDVCSSDLTYRIAEKCKHPNCQYDQGPCQPRHEKQRKHRNRGRNRGKFAPFRMHGWKAPFDAAMGCRLSVFWCLCRSFGCPLQRYKVQRGPRCKDSVNRFPLGLILRRALPVRLSKFLSPEKEKKNKKK